MVRDKHFDILLIRWHDFPGNQSGSQFSHSVMSDSLRLRGLQHTRLPCPSPTPRSYSNSCPCQGCHPTISSSVVPFSSRLQSFPQWISVARGRWVWGGENQGRSQKRGNSLYFFHLWEWAVDHQTQQFMNLRAWMLGLCGGNHCLNGHREEWRRRIWDSVDRYLFPPVWYIFSGVFLRRGQ